MRIKRHRTPVYDYTFLLTEKEAKEIIQYANAERTSNQDPMTQIVSATFQLKGDAEYANDTVKLKVVVKTKPSISR